MPRVKVRKASEVIDELTRCLEAVLNERRPPKRPIDYLVSIPIHRHRELVKIESDRAIAMARDCGLNF